MTLSIYANGNSHKTATLFISGFCLCILMGNMLQAQMRDSAPVMQAQRDETFEDDPLYHGLFFFNGEHETDLEGDIGMTYLRAGYEHTFGGYPYGSEHRTDIARNVAGISFFYGNVEVGPIVSGRNADRYDKQVTIEAKAAAAISKQVGFGGFASIVQHSMILGERTMADSWYSFGPLVVLKTSDRLVLHEALTLESLNFEGSRYYSDKTKNGIALRHALFYETGTTSGYKHAVVIRRIDDEINILEIDNSFEAAASENVTVLLECNALGIFETKETIFYYELAFASRILPTSTFALVAGFGLRVYGSSRGSGTVEAIRARLGCEVKIK